MFPATAEARLNDAKLLVHRGAHRAEELLDQGKTHIKRHPVIAVTGAFVLGFGAGVLVGSTLLRRR
ncbi:MAG: hypothetical protein ACM3JB_27455 [Acidobacteriaceae bacterium]